MYISKSLSPTTKWSIYLLSILGRRVKRLKLLKLIKTWLCEAMWGYVRPCEAITTRQREVCSKRPSLTRSYIQTQHIFAYSLIISVQKHVFSYVKLILKERYFHNTQNEIRYIIWNNQSHKKIQDFGISGERAPTKKKSPCHCMR